MDVSDKPVPKFKTIIVKWSGSEYIIDDLENEDTVGILKQLIFRKTSVRPERQKLINLKYKGKLPADDVKISQMELKDNFKLMMVGSLEQDIADVCSRPDDVPEVLNDFEEENTTDETSFENKEVYLAKINKRIKDYNIEIVNPPREGKKLLVLDIDYTLFDHRSSAETGSELMRPYLHEFLESCYQYYDIVIWSATSMKWILEKMKLLGVSTNPNYKISFYLDSNAMITVHCPKRGVVEVKPLGVIWGKFEQYSPKNSIMLDDIRRNFLMNPKSGLRIRPFFQAHLNRAKDTELLKLSTYLKDIAENCDDFDKLNHRKWETYKP